MIRRAANLDFLHAGQSLTITYTVKVNDGTTDSGTQNVTFTITGTNDGPVIAGDTTGSVQEDGVQTTSGILTADDPDAGATASLSIVRADFSCAMDSFTVTKITSPSSATILPAADRRRTRPASSLTT